MANIIFGLVTIAMGLWGLSVWWWSVAEVLRGILPVLAILFGLVALGAGVTKVREGGSVASAVGDEDLMGQAGQADE
ncbi:MAG: hypothetical protein HQL52_03050 [Magnetococcales bacterium]|nr:hypothetical protein [Magnetococcales bacterium]